MVKPEVVIPGTAELIDEVEESKITGEEERYSKLDLPTFVANLDGAKAFYDTLSPLVKAKDPALDKQIQTAFDNAYAEVNKLKKGGDFVSYDELTRRPAERGQADRRGARRAAGPRTGRARREEVTDTSRRRFLQGAAGGGAAVAAGAFGVSRGAAARRRRATARTACCRGRARARPGS